MAQLWGGLSGLTWGFLLQSETCSVAIPELEFELGMGALGGKFTTLEGLLKDIKDLVSGPVLLSSGALPEVFVFLRRAVHCSSHASCSLPSTVCWLCLWLLTSSFCCSHLAQWQHRSDLGMLSTWVLVFCLRGPS